MTQPQDMRDLRDTLVLAALDQVPFDGWSRRALEEAALAAGFDASMAERAFPGGPVQAVAHFVGLADRRFEDEVREIDLTGLKMPQRLALLIRRRIAPWTQHKESIRRAVSLLSLPTHAATAARLTWNTVDSLWWTAGDKSTDFSFYTKRASLTAVYGATLLYWLDDASEDGAESWAFLERRLSDAGRLPKLKERLRHQLLGLPALRPGRG